MSIAILWESGDSTVQLASGSYIGFYGVGFNQAIPFQNYNDTTIVTNKLGTANLGTLPNFKYTTPGYAIWNNVTNGLNSGSILNAATDDMTLHIQITSGSASRLTSVNLIAYKDNDINTGPSEATVLGFEHGTGNWSLMNGASSPLALTPHTESLVHDYWIGLSVAPKARGANTTVTFALKAKWA